MQKRENERRDPFEDSPLRDAGESLRDDLDDVLIGNVLAWGMGGTFLVILAGLEWYRWFFRFPVSPVLYTCIAAAGVALAIWRASVAFRGVAALRLGLKGERFVGQFLQNELAPLGYRVLHDICFESFNIDHVAVGPGGVFAIETKTRSKPLRGETRVTYDGTEVLVDGHKPDRNPIVQARAGAASLRKLLLEYSGHDTTVRGVVLFPGWFVERQPKGVEVWVLNEKAFVGFLKRETAKLTPDRQQVITSGLERYIREKASS